MSIGISLAEKGVIPTFLIRKGIRDLLKQRLNELSFSDSRSEEDYKETFIEKLKQHHNIAIHTKEANDQHYEVPASFFQLALGKHLKYSSALYENGAKNLDEAEDHMIQLYATRAGIVDGMEVLDLGCGWGSFSLWLAERYPNCKITCLSNSHQQREYIESTAKQKSFKNIKVITEDINKFSIDKKFDRIVSIEMFEHMRNYDQLFQKVAGLLKDDGKLFVHIFCHKSFPYFFETEGDDNWMGALFFTGGIMPSTDLFSHFDQSLTIENQWNVNGQNYEKTSLAWLENMDNKKAEVMKIFEKTYGTKEAGVWFNRWRIFFLSCAELFGYNEGKEWQVGHYLFQKKARN